MRKEAGFTLIELLSVMALASILMTLGAFSLRQYWLVRSLTGATGEVVAQLRTLQQNAASESSPITFGAAFRTGSSSWTTIRYSLGANITDPADDACTVRSRLTLDTGVTFLGTSTFGSSSQVSSSVLASGCGVTSADRVVFFFPKGTATSGHVDVRQPSLERSTAVCVSALTARVSQRTIAEAASC
jgi:prepilin-type N-terminal cleavage/methylation domain-containing protein